MKDLIPRSPKHSPRAKTIYLCTAAIIASLYVVLTLVSNALGLASGVIQCRLSEALCILPFFTAAAVPGLTVGCIIANIITTGSIVDIVFGSLATFIGALGARALRKFRWITPVPTILANTLILPFVLKFMLHLNESVWFLFVTIFIGEVISAGFLGMAFLLVFEKLNKNNKIFK